MDFAQPVGKPSSEENPSGAKQLNLEEAKAPVTKEDFIRAFNDIFTSLKGDNIPEVNEKIKQIENDEEMRRLRKKIKKNQTEKSKPSQPESISDLATKLNQYLTDFKKVLDEHSQAKTTFVRLKSDKEKLIVENDKVIVSKNRLDGLSRTLQKQNQDYFENHKKIIDEEKNKRQTLAESFQKKIREIYSKLEENNLARQQKIRENEILKEKSKEVEHHYETREVLFSTEMKKKELESQIHETQLEQKLLMIENESNLKGSYREQLDKAKEAEKIVSDKLKIYVDKCSEFQDLMQISNDSFVKFKKDMDKLTQKIKNLDTNNINAQRKIEKSDVAVIDMLTENKKLQKELNTNTSQIELFTSLQRKLEENIKAKEEEIKGLKENK